MFKNHEERYLEKSRRPERNQLDFIFVNHRFANSVKNCKTLPGANPDIDHNLLIADIQTKLKHYWNIKTQYWKIKDGKCDFTTKVEEKISVTSPK